MERVARVVQLQSTAGALSIELYNNFCADSFWQLARSGQLRRLTFRQLLGGFALLGEVETVQGHSTTASEVDAAARSPDGVPLLHVGAGLLSCRPTIGAVTASRLLITLSPQPQLDKTHVVFGRVYSGIHTLEQISRMQVGADFVLYSPVTVVKCSTAVLARGTAPQNATAKVAPAPCAVKSPYPSSILATLE
ncbi:cyclophilin 3 / CyP3 [Leishmania donovani]|uniref:peptidylprolyl isomerase n=3 Tax=Leishmania donovani species complex TaxID=38574 RepID=A0A6L0XDW6_LEIIN|nr:putative cyclophilin 3 [Leishmania infantum JPCM5]XP_003860915.1 cyclophilin type peptidyl-prolyl cis-trans isomerase, putative [Leishmania donovani]CAC9488968.1 cyclophilin_3_-_putative [Leishmania infantum]AYU78885.1 cyclophilin 3, putative [Leishmania donovani]TPP50342.1 Cyclophilin type peptidyl-prolyl cis-trans isomerase/CLD family protein [Leishmania donovani]TPP51412.1 Cyclophilin type peptidyl-prolyl cis-trans isomerase/CLD family protein [Leishmania donovani]CAJ1988884.1 cyclophil|eukprot:XP_001465691.1 putative cyclophilin 3 [Leishmania infantum JPCM5]